MGAMEKVWEGIYRGRYQFFGIGVNAYLLVDGGEAALVDSGPVDGGVLSDAESTLKSLGLGIEALKVLIHTHHHLDHCGGSAELSQLSWLRIAYHPEELEYLRNLPEIQAKRAERWGMFIKWSGVPKELAPKKPPYEAPNDIIEALCKAANTEVGDGDTLRVGSKTLRAIHTPGHTIGHICIYVEEDCVLFSGDHVLRAEAPLPFEHTIGDYVKSLEKLKDLEMKVILPGHGKPISDPQTAVEELINREKNLRNKILELLSQEPMTAFELMRKTWEMAPTNPFFAVVQILAHIRQLSEEGLIEWVEEEGGYRYRLARS